jgi:hypothetical protein
LVINGAAPLQAVTPTSSKTKALTGWLHRYFKHVEESGSDL